MAEARLQPGTPSLGRPSPAAWCWLGTPEPCGTAQPALALPLCTLITNPSFLLLTGGEEKIKICVSSYQISSPQSFANNPPRIGCFINGVFLLILSPIHLFCCCLLLFQAHFSARCMDFRKTFDKDGPGSWMINIIFLTCLALSATCNCSLPRVGSSSLTFPQLPRSFPCFLSPWVCAAFSVNS